MMKLLMFAAAVCCSGVGLADEGKALPDYGLADKCRAQSKSISGKASSGISADCVQSEQAAYDSLKKYWPRLAEAQKSKCIAASAGQKLGNYKILQQCLARDTLRVDGQLRDNPTGK